MKDQRKVYVGIDVHSREHKESCFPFLMALWSRLVGGIKNFEMCETPCEANCA